MCSGCLPLQAISATPETTATVTCSGVAAVAAIFGTEEGNAKEIDPLREAYEERAAILEFDAGMSREEAEKAARRMTGYEEK